MKRVQRFFKQIEITIIGRKIETYMDTEKDREKCGWGREAERV